MKSTSANGEKQTNTKEEERVAANGGDISVIRKIIKSEIAAFKEEIFKYIDAAISIKFNSMQENAAAASKQIISTEEVKKIVSIMNNKINKDIIPRLGEIEQNLGRTNTFVKYLSDEMGELDGSQYTTDYRMSEYMSSANVAAISKQGADDHYNSAAFEKSKGKGGNGNLTFSTVVLNDSNDDAPLPKNLEKILMGGKKK